MSISLTIASTYWGHFDYEVTHFINSLNAAGAMNTLFTWIAFTGNTIFMILTIIALYVGGARKEALVFTIILAAVSAVTLGLKAVTMRPRPDDLGVLPNQEGPGDWDRFIEGELAFPSLHTANAFAFATTISIYHRKFRYALFAWALLIAFTRMFLGVHYFTDVVGGAIVGTVISLIVTRLAKRSDNEISRIAKTGERYPRNWRNAASLPFTFVRQLVAIVRVLAARRAAAASTSGEGA